MALQQNQSRIFVVDEEDVIASTLAIILCQQGFEALVCSIQNSVAKETTPDERAGVTSVPWELSAQSAVRPKSSIQKTC